MIIEDSQNFIPLEVASERFGMSIDTLRRRIATGDLHVYIDGKDRRKRLVSPEEIETMLRPVPLAILKEAS